MTLTDDLILAIYLSISYVGLSFCWFWLRWSKMLDNEQDWMDGHWYDWVLCIPVLMLAGIMGMAIVIFAKSDGKFTDL